MCYFNNRTEELDLTSNMKWSNEKIPITTLFLCFAVESVFTVDDRNVAFCDFRGGVAKIVCIILATPANGNVLLP